MDKAEKEKSRRKRPDRQIYRPGVHRLQNRHGAESGMGDVDYEMAGGGEDSSPDSQTGPDRGSSAEKEVDEIMNRLLGTAGSGTESTRAGGAESTRAGGAERGSHPAPSREVRNNTDRTLETVNRREQLVDSPESKEKASLKSKRKTKRPDIQIYVPKGRQQSAQEESVPSEESGQMGDEGAEEDDEALAQQLHRQVDLRSDSVTVTLVNDDLPPPPPPRGPGHFLDRMVDHVRVGIGRQNRHQENGQSGHRQQMQADRGGNRGDKRGRGGSVGGGRGEHMRSLSGGSDLGNWSDASHDSMEWDYRAELESADLHHEGIISTEVFTNSKFDNALPVVGQDKQQQKSRKDRKNRSTQEEDRGAELDRFPGRGRGRGREKSADRMSNVSNDSRKPPSGGTPKQQRRRDRDRRHSMDELEERLKSPKSSRRRDRWQSVDADERLKSPKGQRRRDRWPSADVDERLKSSKPQTPRERRSSGGDVDERLKSPKPQRVRDRQHGGEFDDRLKSPKFQRVRERRQSGGELDERTSVPKPQRRRERRHSERTDRGEDRNNRRGDRIERRDIDRRDDRRNDRIDKRDDIIDKRDDRPDRRNERPVRRDGGGNQERNNRRDLQIQEKEDKSNRDKNKEKRKDSNTVTEEESNGFLARGPETHLNWEEEVEEEEERQAQQKEQERKDRDRKQREQRESKQSEWKKKEKEKEILEKEKEKEKNLSLKVTFAQNERQVKMATDQDNSSEERDIKGKYHGGHGGQGHGGGQGRGAQSHGDHFHAEGRGHAGGHSHGGGHGRGDHNHPGGHAGGHSHGGGQGHGSQGHVGGHGHAGGHGHGGQTHGIHDGHTAHGGGIIHLPPKSCIVTPSVDIHHQSHQGATGGDPRGQPVPVPRGRGARGRGSHRILYDPNNPNKSQPASSPQLQFHDPYDMADSPNSTSGPPPFTPNLGDYYFDYQWHGGTATPGYQYDMTAYGAEYSSSPQPQGDSFLYKYPAQGAYYDTGVYHDDTYRNDPGYHG